MTGRSDGLTPRQVEATIEKGKGEKIIFKVMEKGCGYETNVNSLRHVVNAPCEQKRSGSSVLLGKLTWNFVDFPATVLLA